MSLAGSSTDSAVEVEAAADRPSLPALYLVLTKARLSSLVVLTTAVGYVLASGGAPIDWLRLLWTVLGTALAAGSANALNQLWEMGRDRRMRRTRGRPLPSGAMAPLHAFLFAIAIGYAGIWVLATQVNLVAAALALLTLIAYVLIYTPLKVRTTLNTIVGALCGAVPPMIGWVAVTGRPGPGGWLLAALLFIWQLPHFLSLAWLYREDYGRGGFLMLPVVDPQGEVTARAALSACVLLLLIGLLCPLIGLAGWIFAVGALGLGLWIVGRSVMFYRERSEHRARRLFRASLIYLTLVLGLLLLDRGPIPTLAPDSGEVYTLRLVQGSGG